MRRSSLDIQQIMRWIVTAIVMMVAVVLLGVVLKVAGFLLAYAIKGLVILLLIAILIRFFAMMRDRR